MENIDWKSLPFAYMKTDYNVRCYYKNGKWGELEVSDSEEISISIASTCLHYGQEAFEGLKAYMGKDGRVRLFRWQENAKRLQRTARGILMQEVPTELFEKAVKKVVSLNKKYIPPYGQGATLYIRPLLVGLGPEVGVKAAKEYLFMVFVTPVGPYFKGGFKPTNIMITRDFDRAAPLGTGCFKVGGNYAASLRSLKVAAEAGYSTALYLDAREKKYIDEAGPANFFGIKENKYITPLSESILPSITNMCLMTLAKDMGMVVERRQIPLDELESFEEVGECGTAAVITPINKIYDPDKEKTYSFCVDDKPGEISSKLYHHLVNIQFGDEEDKFGWIDFVE